MTEVRSVDGDDGHRRSLDVDCRGDGDASYPFARKSTKVDDYDVAQRLGSKEAESPYSRRHLLTGPRRALRSRQGSHAVVEAAFASEVGTPRLPASTRWRRECRGDPSGLGQRFEVSGEPHAREAIHKVVFFTPPRLGADKHRGFEGNRRREGLGRSAPSVNVGVQIGSNDTHDDDLTLFCGANVQRSKGGTCQRCLWPPNLVG